MIRCSLMTGIGAVRPVWNCADAGRCVCLPGTAGTGIVRPVRTEEAEEVRSGVFRKPSVESFLKMIVKVRSRSFTSSQTEKLSIYIMSSISLSSADVL